MVEGGELLVDEDLGQVGRELTASAGQEYAQRPISSVKGMRIRDGGLAGELFCKKRYFDCRLLHWMRVGICFAILGVPFACSLFSYICSWLHDTRDGAIFLRESGRPGLVQRFGTANSPPPPTPPKAIRESPLR